LFDEPGFSGTNEIMTWSLSTRIGPYQSLRRDLLKPASAFCLKPEH
jgi:hypothetical protein